MPQTYLSPAIPQITCNIATGSASVGSPCASPAATCNGDVQTLTRTITTVVFSKILTATTNTFLPGDAGKAMVIPGIGSAGTGDYNVISTVDSPTQVTMVNNYLDAVTTTSKALTFGSSDSAAFLAFNTWAVANQGTNQVVLTVPNGSNCWFGTTVAGNWASGVKNLIVEGTGATINSVGGFAFSLGGSGNCQRGLTSASGCSARIQTVSAGATQLTFTAASFSAGYASRFSVGGNVLIGGLDPQALFQAPFGDPMNLNYFEWRKVTAICNNTAGCVGSVVITLDIPLTNSYSSLWPEYNSGGTLGVSDAGGPATVWAYPSSWETTVEYRGLTISQDGQTYARGRNATYRNVTFTGGLAGIPTENETWSAINTNFGFANMETDKLVGTMLLDGVTIAKIVNQSTSTDTLIIRNSTFSLGLDGGAKTTTITDSNLGAWAPGIFAYGSTGTANPTTCTRCTIASINYTFGPVGNEAWWFKSGGVITMPNAAAQGAGPGQRYFVPGATVFYGANGTNPPISFACCETFGSFQVGTMTADPWPATDNQTLTTTINISSASKNLNVPSGPFVSGDVGKTIIVTGAGSGGGDLRTFITGRSSTTDVTLFNAASTTLAGSSTIQWGTSNTYIQTNQSGGFPSLSALSTNSILLKALSSMNVTCDVCNAGNLSSDGYAISIQAGATPAKPLGSYVSKQYIPTSAQGDLAVMPNRGVFKSLSINVTAAATAAGSVSLNPGGAFHWFMIDQNIFSAPVPADWLPVDLSINLKQTGNRVITPSGVTCNGSAGACSGDTINRPANLATMWVGHGSMTPYMGSAFTGAPTFTITMQTDPIQ
jgi:hypothetical protein